MKHTHTKFFAFFSCRGSRYILQWECAVDGLCEKEAYGTSFLKPDATYTMGGEEYVNYCFEKDESTSTVSFKSGSNLFDCYVSSCWQDALGTGPGRAEKGCVSPSPHAFAFNFSTTKEVRIIIVSEVPSERLGILQTPSTNNELKLSASFSFNNFTSPALVDGDCRLRAAGSTRVLNGTSGDIQFNAAAWMDQPTVTCMNHELRPTRVRWVIKPDSRPGTPIKSITLTIKSMDLDPRYAVDMLYMLPNCDTVTATQYSDDMLWDSSFQARILNGNGLEKKVYGRAGVPCPVTINSPCVVLELDMARRYTYTQESRDALEAQGVKLEDDIDYTARFKGFTAAFTASTEDAAQTAWVSGGATSECKPEYSTVPPQKPRFVWNELCCSNEEGNGIFGGQFFGNLSLDANIPAGGDAEDYKIIYRIEPYNPDGVSYLTSEFKCDDTDFNFVDGWYPSEMLESDKEQIYRSEWAATQSGEYPASSTQATQARKKHGTLWYDKDKFVKVRGISKIVSPNYILLNSPKPASDRPITKPTMHANVMITAVTCKANRIGQNVFWVQSTEVAVERQVFALGPSLTMVVRLFNQPANLVRYKIGATTDEQLALSTPLTGPLCKQITDIIGLKTPYFGVLKQVDAVNITIIRSENARRAGYKTPIVLKQGYPNASETTIAPQNPGNQDTTLFDVNISISILCRSVRQAAEFSDKLSQSRRQLGGGFQLQVQVPKSTQVGEGGACLSHYDCTETGLFCSKAKRCSPCRFCSIDKFDSVDGKCPKELCPKSGMHACIHLCV
jgi:hypothetical protein